MWVVGSKRGGRKKAFNQKSSVVVLVQTPIAGVSRAAGGQGLCTSALGSGLIIIIVQPKQRARQQSNCVLRVRRLLHPRGGVALRLLHRFEGGRGQQRGLK